MQNLEGLGWKFLLLCKSWLDGLMIWSSNALMEFALACRANSQEFGAIRTALLRPVGGLLKFLCRLHLKDPGCVVGEHRHVRACDFELGDDAVLVAMEKEGVNV
ncbi:hypothetical protein PVK06_013546 [Gossypium arboreum]|uniref:Uncharacterized protein n=1 Tax=Gossypium arboreum TaxID=29729 RepID=A0ABR0PRY5_GOSAR|nr:hypothetical protein PVK06_013546 [Gossypium arboreum]